LSLPARLVLRFCYFLLCTSTLAGVDVRADISKADEIRLAYLLNFARYVTWSKTNEQPQFSICVVDDDALVARLKTATEGKEIDGRKAVSHLVDNPDTISQCDVLYIPGTMKSQSIEKYLVVAARFPILTVGEDTQFLDKGGAIRFVVLEGTVRFEIHLDHVRKAGLDMSSRLLKHAERVFEDYKKPEGLHE